ncbi:hypothetical protein L207DRAFT_575058 [Hyaloscypha variabilis F]|uniref:Extracellular serine-rich protein n=1 Tax=Hyaloscypha variabilis (strain UAMH 11265 / GT02V1 / F) TaxID=1149755 RepID=A0A2J6SC95_HYAVF|nr:hypothetical protein L207DRAFT_575058 [Hyaloscypha variabilis F]
MFSSRLRYCVFALALCQVSVYGAVHCNHKRSFAESVALNHQSLYVAPEPVPLVEHSAEGNLTFQANTTNVIEVSATAEGLTGTTISSTALVIARDKASAYSAYSGLNDRGIPYQILIVPSSGANLPALSANSTYGNYGLIVVLSEVSYNKGGTIGYQSALTASQWQTLYNYQVQFGVRMVRLDSTPSADTGTTNLGGCCTGEQLVYISDSSAFPQAGLKTGAGLSTVGLYHYRAKITNASIATEFMQFAAPANTSYGTGVSTAGVINNINGRQQMVFYIPFSTDWSLTSNFLQHAWITWATRGLYLGWRRAMLNTQIDDMFLETPIYASDPITNYRVTAADVQHHIGVMQTINKKLPAGSNWVIEVGHNGNGNVEQADTSARGATTCAPGPIEYPDQVDTPLEYAKPIGTGKTLWPVNTTSYANYSAACLERDALLTFWLTPAYRDAFAHISHTFTHEDQDNSTYFDVYREISWNQAWLQNIGIMSASKWSGTGIIPPAITGLHNGDALRAWGDLGIVHVVGDNTRPVLLNTVNEHWPLMSTVKDNGYAGIQITPRWASNIYYNCDLADCTVAEWIATSAGKGDFFDLLNLERDTNVRHLMGLRHDPYMFHQANLRYVGADDYTINGVDQTMSLFELWTTVITNEYTRLVTWPVVSLKHDDIASSFRDRMIRDNCKGELSYTLDASAKSITAVTVTTTGNTCAAPIPVTFPGTVVSQQGATPEQLGTDPLVLWVKMTGSPVTFQLTTPVAL